MYPIAWAVTKRENPISWAWFISLLTADLEMEAGIGCCIISNQQKQLANAVKT